MPAERAQEHLVDQLAVVADPGGEGGQLVLPVVDRAGDGGAAEQRHHGAEAEVAGGREAVVVAADEVFAPLVASSSGNWGALAGVQTLVSALRRNQPDEADSVIEILSSRFRFEELAVLVPSDLRDEILKTYAKSYLSLGGILQFDLNRMQKIERAAAIDRLLSPDGFGDFYNQMELMRVYHFAEKWPEALAVIEPLLKRQRSALVMRHFCRILRLSGQAKRAIEELDASLSEIGRAHV